MKGLGHQVPNKTESLSCHVLGAETRLRAEESRAAAGQVRVTGPPSADPDPGYRAGTGSVGY